MCQLSPLVGKKGIATPEALVIVESPACRCPTTRSGSQRAQLSYVGVRTGSWVSSACSAARFTRSGDEPVFKSLVHFDEIIGPPFDVSDRRLGIVQFRLLRQGLRREQLDRRALDRAVAEDVAE